MKIELFNSECSGISTFSTPTLSDIESMYERKVNLIYLLKGYHKDGKQFLLFASHTFKNVIIKYHNEVIADKHMGVENKYIITLEEGL